MGRVDRQHDDDGGKGGFMNAVFSMSHAASDLMKGLTGRGDEDETSSRKGSTGKGLLMPKKSQTTPANKAPNKLENRSKSEKTLKYANRSNSQKRLNTYSSDS